MFRNSLGVQGRGPSNSIYSPGVSAIFGGGDVAPKPAAPARPATTNNVASSNYERPMTRYTDTFKSNAFSHATYQPPITNNKSAATVVLEKTGTTIEDFGRRDPRKLVEQDLKASSNGPAKTLAADLKTSQEGRLKQKLTEKYSDISNVKDSYQKFENKANQQRTLFERERQQFKEEAKNQIKQFYDKKQQEWNEKANNQENTQKTLQLTEQIKQSQQEKLIEDKTVKTQLGSQIRSQIDGRSQAVKEDKNHSLALGQQRNGFAFECYTRDGAMKQQHYDNTQKIKSQIRDDDVKKFEQTLEDKRPPPNLVRTQDLIEMKVKQKQEDLETKERNKQEMLLSQDLRLKNKMSEENSLYEAKRLEREAAERLNQRARDGYIRSELEKRNYGSFAKQDIDGYENKKYDEKTGHAKDTTNKETTLAMQEQIQRSLQERKVEDLTTKQRLASQLDGQLNEKSQLTRGDREQDIDLGRKSNGFQFECYPRQAEMIRQGYQNTGYIVSQIDQDQRRKREERNEQRKAPERLWTADKLNAKKEIEMVERFNEKVKNTVEFRTEYDRQMSLKERQKQEEKMLNAQLENGIVSVGQKKAYERFVHDHTQKHEHGGQMRSQLDHNQKKKVETIAEEKKAPEIVQGLRSEAREEQAFHKSKKPVITKYEK